MTSVYRKFEDSDRLYSTIYAKPLVSVTSGSDGWSGNVGVSSSLSLYGGLRSRSNVRQSDFSESGIAIYPLDPLDTHSIDKVIFVSGSYPSTGSITYVLCSDVPARSPLKGLEGWSYMLDPDEVAETDTFWGDRHFSPISTLFDYYSSKDDSYFIGSYDRYSLFFAPVSSTGSTVRNCVMFGTSSLEHMDSLFMSSGTVSAWVKPLDTSVSVESFSAVIAQRNWLLGYYVSTGVVRVYASGSWYTASTTVNKNVWNHIAFSFGGGKLHTFVNFNEDVFDIGDSIISSSSPICVGAYTASKVLSSSNSYANGVNGFIHETRVYDKTMTLSELSSSCNATLVESSSAGLLHYARFNDGPLADAHGMSVGSGAFDYSPYATHGTFVNIGLAYPSAPAWQPLDSQMFKTPLVAVDKAHVNMRVVHVPSMFYGRQIEPGTVRMTCNAYSSLGIVRTLIDDGKGALYVSGSLLHPLSDESYGGCPTFKVGNVFYPEGLIVITDPSLLDFGDSETGSSNDPASTFECSFRGHQRIMTKTLMCRLAQGDANASNNPTFSYVDGSRRIARDPDLVTYVTAIGLYDDKRKLVAVAKLAQPVRKREKDKIDIRLRIDF